MASNLPNLNALRAFEATARLSSFTRAAQELCVTQAAISHQVRQLEETLGVRLFERAHRRVVLTEAGSRLFPTISSAFREIDAVLREVLESGDAHRTLSVQVTPSFGALWLARRLQRFWTAYPEIDLRIYHALPHETHDVRRVDLAIRWGSGNWEGQKAESLFECRLLPVCSPKYLRPDQPLNTPQDLRFYTLLHEDGYEDWSAWFRAAKIAFPTPPRGTIIDDSNTLIEAAINRQGIALGRLPLVREQLEQGILVSPFRLSIRSEGAYHLVYDDKAVKSHAFEKFREFLIEQAREETGDLRHLPLAETV